MVTVQTVGAASQPGSCCTSRAADWPHAVTIVETGETGGPDLRVAIDWGSQAALLGVCLALRTLASRRWGSGSSLLEQIQKSGSISSK